MSLKKKVAIGGGVVAALLLAVAIFVGLNLNRLTKSAIETMGPKILGVPVKVGTVLLSPWGGTGTISDLEISSPPGFKFKHLCKIKKFSIGWRWRSLASGPVDVTQLEVRSPEVWWSGSLQENNLAIVQRNAEKFKSSCGARRARYYRRESGHPPLSCAAAANFGG